MPQTKMTTIGLKIAELRPDPIQFKPYSPAFAPEELYLDVEVPSGLVLPYDPLAPAKQKVLKPDGYKYLLNYLATLVAEAHDERLKEMSRE